MKGRQCVKSASSRAVLVCALGLSVPASALNLDNSQAEELKLARAYVDVPSPTAGSESLFPEITESAQVAADFTVGLPEVSAEDATVQQRSTSSMLWLLVASVLGFSVVARRRSPE